MIDGVRNEDVEQLTFAAESFDLVTSNGVFEHVNHDERGYREIHRVLRRGGAMIMSVPLYGLPMTQRLSHYRTDGTLEWLGPPEYHDSRHGGALSAPVVWYHSRHDIVPRVQAAGFAEVSLVEVLLTPAQREPYLVVRAVKG
jgi:ubiquinone/menaquinone biosynthesis C-methylase UbiE